MYTECFYIALSSQDFTNIDRSDRSNMAWDGAAIMEPQAHFDWFSQSMLLLVRSLLRQLPPHYQVRVDANSFLQSMSFLHDGQRIPASPWVLAPDAPVHQPQDLDADPLSFSQTDHFNSDDDKAIFGTFSARLMFCSV